MSLLEQFIEQVSKKQLFSKNDRLIIAASGGLDSSVLCELCKQAGYSFIIAHCNFKLRGKESERDKEFVIGLAKEYEAEIEIMEFDTEEFARKNKLSIQEAARKLRYDWFSDLVGSQEPGVRSQKKVAEKGLEPPNSDLRTLLLTAHHADDNIETLLMNFFRGTGLKGLTGIPETTGHIRRPLLPFTREQLYAFAKENNLEFVEDSSNQDTKYTRNYFRHELIPAIAKVYPEVQTNLLDNIKRFREIESLYKIAVKMVRDKLCTEKGNEIHIPVKQLMRFENRALIYEIIHDYGFSEKQVDEVIKLCNTGSGKYISSDNYRVIRHRHWLIISPISSEKADNIIIEDGVGSLEFAVGKLQIERLPAAGCRLPSDQLTACLDSKEITYPLLLRKWKQGDYFYPLGMKKKKKLSRFFIDQKLSKTEKENTWVLEMDKKIIWVVGYRIDERFKVNDKTMEVLKLVFAPKQVK